MSKIKAIALILLICYNHGMGLMREAPAPEWVIRKEAPKVTSEFILPAQILEIADTLETEESKLALLRYAKYYFLQFEDGFDDATARLRDDALDQLEELSGDNHQTRMAMYAVEKAGLDYKDYKTQQHITL